MAFTNTTLTVALARLAERYESVPFWTADQARRAIVEGLRIWNAVTGTWRITRTIANVPANSPYLGVSGLLTKATRVVGGAGPLDPTSLSGLDFGFRNWEVTAESGGPRYWAPVSLSTIAIYPQFTSVGSLTIDGIGAVTAPVVGGDYIDLGNEELDTLLGYALHVLSFTQGASALNGTKPLYVAFFKAAAQRNAVFAASSLYRRIVGFDRTRVQTPPERAKAEAMAVVPVEG